MRLKPRFLFGGAIIAAAIVYLIVTAIRNTAEYYLNVNEVAGRQTALAGQALRVAGRVKPGTVRWDPSSLTLAFAIVQIPKADGAHIQPVDAADPISFAVICKGQPKPDMFAENRDVIIEGRLVGRNAIAADQVLTSCPSKYAPGQDK